jgi:cell fate regulator YaaT (PSP1 superfamily)
MCPMVAEIPEYLVSHGKTGAFDRFVATDQERFSRGDRVVLRSLRGLTLGVVLCQVTPRQANILAFAAPGQLLRRASSEDEAAQREMLRREQQIFDAGRALAKELDLPIDILDTELSLDGRRAILQYLLAGANDIEPLAGRLAAQFDLEVWLENLAMAPPEEHHDGCGEPNCGKTGGGSGCDTCSTSGGCSSCGSKKVDLRDYFSHLRDKLDERRKPLL